MFFKEEGKGFSVEIKGTKRRVNHFTNMFDMSFPVKAGSDPHSKVLEKVYVLERFVIYFNGGREVVNVQEVRYDVSFATKEHHLDLFDIELKTI